MDSVIEAHACSNVVVAAFVTAQARLKLFFGPFDNAITSLGEEGADLGAFCAFVGFVLV